MPGRAEGGDPESMLPFCGHGFRIRELRSRPVMTRVDLIQRRVPLLYVISFPVQHAGYLVAIPFVDAIVELGTEVIVLGPLDRPAAEPLGVDLQVFHGAANLRGIARPPPAPPPRLHPP